MVPPVDDLPSVLSPVQVEYKWRELERERWIERQGLYP